MSKDSNLHSILHRFLVQINYGRTISLTTTEGADLMSVNKSEEQLVGAESNLVVNCLKVLEQSNKYGLGAPKFTISWSELGILVQFRLDALIITLIMDDNANLGLIEDHLSSLQRILKPFSSTNFINHQSSH